MFAPERVLTTDDVMILNHTKIGPAMQAVALNVMINNDNQAFRSDVWTAIEDLLIPVNHLLETQYKSKNQFAGITSVWSSAKQWIKCQSGRWVATDASIVEIRRYVESNLGYHGVDLEQFMDVLNKVKDQNDSDQEQDEVIDPIVVDKEVKPDVKETTDLNMESIIRKQIQDGYDHIARLKQILKDHYGSDV